MDWNEAGRVLVYWIAASIIIGSTYAFLRGVEDFMNRDRIEPENEDAIIERMEKMRDAGTEVGL